ncbi:MAG: hypothetical protein D6811_02625, partial [Alphaproteobacteria bacterium]
MTTLVTPRGTSPSLTGFTIPLTAALGAFFGLIAGSAFAAGFIAQVLLSRWADRGYGGLLMRGGLAVAIAGMVWLVVAEALWEWLAARA